VLSKNVMIDIRKNIILIISNDNALCVSLKTYLLQYEFSVFVGSSWLEAQEIIEANNIDCTIYDVSMTFEDGVSLCTKLNSKTNSLLVLTNLKEEQERILYLEVGADDCLVKPINPREILAKIRAILRPNNRQYETNLNFRDGNKRLEFANGWCLDTATRHLCNPQGQKISLKYGEYNLLLAFLERPQRVLTRDQLLDITCSHSDDPLGRNIDVAVSRLRNNIEPDSSKPQIITTIRGGGYMLACQVSKY
jgi:two-component system, OmpR family, response regulator